MKKQRIFGLVLALLLLLSVLQPAALAAETETPLHGVPLRVVANENGFGIHMETEDGTRVAAAYPQGNSGKAKAPQNLPARYDSRDLGLVTSVKDQDSSGICWAFSVISCLETNAIKKGLIAFDAADYSESHLAWFSINSKTTDKNDLTYGDGEKANFNAVYQTGGNSAFAIASIARGSGLAMESDFKFPGDYHDFKVYQERDRYISELHMRESNLLDCFENESKEDLAADIKRAVMEYGSVSASFYASADELYYNPTVNGQPTTSYYQNKTSDPDKADHMVTIVGWDDDFPVDNFHPNKRPSKPGAWIIKNSWGIGSEGRIQVPDGYLYISYEDPSLCEIVTYEAMPKDAYDKIYQYDGYLYSASFPMEPEEHAAFANVFTASEDGYLSKVGFFTSDGSETADVSVYRNLNDLSNPESGDLVCTVRADCPYSGYHTVDLTRYAAVKRGETFSAVVRAAQGSALDVPVEANYIGSNYYSANEGESFIYFEDDGGAWYAASEFSNNSVLFTSRVTVCNVPVKAMALSADKHTHRWSTDVAEIAPSCVRDGGKVRVCADCDALDYVERVAASGHNDGNGDGKCDNCGADLRTGDVCPYCHKVHGGGLGRITAFFHRIFYFFRQLFRR